MPPPSAPTRERGRAERLRLHAPVLALGAFVALVVLHVLSYALDTNKFTSVDELGVLEGGRLIADDPLRWLPDTSFFIRGPERLTSVVMAIPNWLFSTTPAELRGSHVLLTLAYFLAAFPLYALARGVGVGRWAAALVGALAIVGPWALYGATMLNVTLGFPLTALFAYAAWRCATRPSVANDVFVLVAAALNTLARTGHTPFAVVAVLAIIYAVWLRRPGGERIGRSLLRLPQRLARTHPILIAVTIAGLLVLAILGPARVVGTAYAPQGRFTLPLDAMWTYAGHWLAQLTIAGGFIPVLVGVPWLVRQLVRPKSVETGVLSVVVLGLFAVWVYLTANHGTQIEERYVAVLGGLSAVAFGAAVYRREPWLIGTLVMAVLAGRALIVYGYPGIGREPFAFFIAPGRLFYEQVILSRLDVLLPGDRSALPHVVAWGVAALAVGVWLLAGPAFRQLPGRLRTPGALAALAIVPVLVLGVAMGRYVLRQYEPATLPELSFGQMAWIEQAAKGRPAVVWANDVGPEGSGRRYLAQLATFFNANTCCGYWANDMPRFLGPNGEVPPRGPTPEYLVRFTGYHPLGFATTTAERSNVYGPYELRVERFDGPPNAAFTIQGPDATGLVGPGGGATIELLPLGRRAGCLWIDLYRTPEMTGRARYRLRLGRTVRRGTLAPERGRTLSLPVAGARRATLAVSGAALRVGEARVGPC